MNKIRLQIAALIVPLTLGILLRADNALATLSLDPAFGTAGIADVDISTGADTARDVAAQGNGALVLAGRSRQTTGADTIDYVTLTRLNGTTGALDGTFGTAGVVTFLPGLTATNAGGGDGRAVAIQSIDQKIIVAGTWVASQNAASQVFVARFDTNGVLDPTFGTAGVTLFTPAGVTSPAANAVALRSDGSIVVAGKATAATASVGFVVGLTAAGAPNPGYADAVIQNPKATGSNFGFNALAILPGDVVLAAGGGGSLVLAQFTSSGAPDASFDADGIASFNFLRFDNSLGSTTTFDNATSLAVLADGRILVAGNAAPSATANTSNRVVARVTANGALDTTFGSGGFAPLWGDFLREQSLNGLGIRPSGDIVIVGQFFDTTDLKLKSFAPTQISPAGIAVSSLAGSLEPVLAALKVLADGSVIATGMSTISGANTAFSAVHLIATDVADGADTVPEPFAFPTQTGLEPGSDVTSSSVTIAGLGAPAPISVSGGLYSIGCTNFGTAAGTISNGQTVCVRNTAAQADAGAAITVLAIGGVPGVFTAVTGDATPDAFSFVDQTNVVASTVITSAPITLNGLTTRTDVTVVNGAYSVGCTSTYISSTTRVDPGVQICVRHTSSATPGSTTDTVLRVGIGTIVPDTFTSTTAGDISPDAFLFTDQTGVAKSTVITSNSVTLTGFTSNAPISVTGGTYSIGCGATFTAAAGTVAPDSQVCVRHTSSAAGGTDTKTILTVGAVLPGLIGVSGTFSSATVGTQDTTPDAFTFTNQTNVPLAAQITSVPITISGFDTDAPISIAGGTYSVGCTFTDNPVPKLKPNSQICVRHTSASTGGAATSTVLIVGGVSGTFTSTTLPGDAVPAAFTFTNQTGVDASATITSAPVTITGIDIASPISVTGGQLSIGCTSTYTTTAGNITNNQTVCLRHTSSFSGLSDVVTTLTIGTVSGTFTSTTRVIDQLPDDFAFGSKTGLALSTVVEADPITITGIDSPVQVQATGPRDSFGRPLFAFSIGCTGTFNGVSGDPLKPGEKLCVEVLSSATDSTGVILTMTVGGTTAGTQKSATFTVTTGETVPDAFTFTDQVGVLLSATVYANPITITGVTAPSRVTITNGQYQINCTGSYTASAGVVSDGGTICVRQAAAGSLSTPTNTVLTVGGISDTFTSTTVVDKPLPGSSAMDAWVLLLLAPLAWYRRVGAPSGAKSSDRA